MFKPNREFQAGLNADDSRRRRQNNSLSLRRKDRESKLQKKRQRILERKQPPPSPASSPNHTNTNGNTSNNSGRYKASLQDLKKLVKGVYTNNTATQFECTKQFRMLLSQAKNPPIREVIDSGVVPRFIQLARNTQFPALQYESLWALLNIASGPAECTAHIIRNGSHNVFIDLLRSPLYEIREQALWALGNIAGDGVELRNLLLSNNILPNIFSICSSTFDKQYVTNFNNNQNVQNDASTQFFALFNTASWTLSNLCRGSSPPEAQHLELLIQCLQCLLQQALNIQNDPDNKREIIMNIGWAFSYLTQVDHFHRIIVNKLGNDGTIQQFVNLMDSESSNIRHPFNRLIGNILTGSDENTKECLNLGILKKYHTILTRLATQKEKKEICWSLSNITAGPLGDKVLVLDNGLYPILIELLMNATYETSKEALWALSNATTDQDKRIINPLVECGIIKALCGFLKKLVRNNKINTKILMVSLECVENILSVGSQHLCQSEPNKFAKMFEEEGGCRYLEELQANDNVEENIYEKCVDIIKKYFDGTEDQTQGRLDYGFGQQPQQPQQPQQQQQSQPQQNNNDNNNGGNASHFSFGVGPNNNNNGAFGF